MLNNPVVAIAVGCIALLVLVALIPDVLKSIVETAKVIWDTAGPIGFFAILGVAIFLFLPKSRG